jgi:hypothetical protein
MTRKFLHRPLHLVLLAAAGLALLTACGGGNEDVNPPEITLLPSPPNQIVSPTQNPYDGQPPFNSPPLPVEVTVSDPMATVTIETTPASILQPNPVLTPPDISFSLANLEQGANTVTVTANDSRGNTNALSFSIVLDTTAPVLFLGPVSTRTPYTEQTIGGITQTGATLELTGAASKEVSPPTIKQYTWEENLTDLLLGDNTVTVTATDEAGNSSDKSTYPPAPVHIFVDPSLPAVTINPLNPSVQNQNVTLTGTAPVDTTVAITAPSPATVADIQQPSDTAGTWKATVQNLPELVLTPVTVTATDGGGNVGEAVVDLIYNQRPKVLDPTDPKSNETGVSVDHLITATFNQPVINVDNTTFTLKDSAGDPVEGTVSFDSVTLKATFAPAQTLSSGRTYTATLSNQIINAAGTSLAKKAWNFTTKSQ